MLTDTQKEDKWRSAFLFENAVKMNRLLKICPKKIGWLFQGKKTGVRGCICAFCI